MKEIYDLMWTNLSNVGIGILIFFLAYISNISFSIYYNIKVLGQNFNKEQAWNSLLKVVAFGIGCSCLVVVITALPLFANYVGLPLPDEFINNLTTISVVGLPLYASVKLCIEAFKKMKKVVESGTITLTEFEDDITEANLKQAEENAKVTAKIVDNLKKNKDEKVSNTLPDFDDGEKVWPDISLNATINDTNEFYPETHYSSEDKEEDNFVKNFMAHAKMDFEDEPKDEPKEEIDSSQQAPDDVNFEQMEAEQLEG